MVFFLQSSQMVLGWQNEGEIRQIILMFPLDKVLMLVCELITFESCPNLASFVEFLLVG